MATFPYSKPQPAKRRKRATSKESTAAMKLMQKTKQNLKYKQCSLCKKAPKEGERVLHKRGGNAGYYNTSDGITIHLTCLRDLLINEPEFRDPEVASRQFEEFRQALVMKYDGTDVAPKKLVKSKK